MESLTSDLVQEELSRGKTGVRNRTSGIQTWSLRMAADRLKTKDKKRYQQTGSEER